MFKKHAAAFIAAWMIAGTAAMAASGPNSHQEAPVARFEASGATHQHAFRSFQDAIPTDRHFAATSGIPASTADARTAQAKASTEDDYTTYWPSMQEEKMLNLINRDRAAQGLYPLEMDAELCRIARIKSEDMRDGGYFAHESPTYGRVKDMLTRFGYAFRGASENIAHHATVEKSQAAFLSSEGHRRNILSSVWTKVGVGVCYDRNGYVYVTQIFAR